MKFIELFYQYSILLPIFISLSLSFPLPLLLKLSFINLVCYCSGVIYDVNLATSRPYAFLVIIYRRKAWQGVENGQVMECVEYFRGWLGNFFDGEYKCPVEGMQPEVTYATETFFSGGPFVPRLLCTWCTLSRAPPNFYLLVRFAPPISLDPF